MLSSENRKLAIIGLGYVGLPIAVAFARRYPGTLGFDVDVRRVEALQAGDDWTHEVQSADLKSSNIRFTNNPEDLRAADVFIVCVPTPVHNDHRPDLRNLQSASETVGRALSKGGIVVYESTVYPGLTEEFCLPVLAEASGLTPSEDFKIGYSPERINPGDKEHTFERIVKVVSAEDRATADLLAEIYGSVVPAGIHIASSIRVAEAAKVLENTQRDLNIALMNELAIICDRMGIRTKDVLDAAGTKWNFLKFTPGLVGGHCIGVDPYYLTSKAEELGYRPEVILAGRRINDTMGAYIAQRTVRFLGTAGCALRDTRVGILGVTFKENIPDIRNSRVPDIVAELRRFGIQPTLHDPLATAALVDHEYRLQLASLDRLAKSDALILATAHSDYLNKLDDIFRLVVDGGVVIDVKSAIDPAIVPSRLRYWSL